MSGPYSPRWYVAQTRPHRETKASLHLGRQGFEVYLPLYLTKRRHARRVDTVASPLYPGYVFVAIDLGVQRWRSIQSTIGVSRLVCRGEDPAAVPEGIVEELKRRQDESGLIRLERRARIQSRRHGACCRRRILRLPRPLRRHGRSRAGCDSSRPAWAQGTCFSRFGSGGRRVKAPPVHRARYGGKTFSATNVDAQCRGRREITYSPTSSPLTTPSKYSITFSNPS